MPNGRCRMHGGKSPGRPPINGRYSLAHRASLAEKAERFLADPAPGDLTAELALMRALLQDFLGHFADGIPMRAEDLQFLAGMIEQVGRLVERIARIRNQAALTQLEVQYLVARIADLTGQYIADPDARRRFLDELRAAAGPAGRGLGPARGGDDGG